MSREIPLSRGLVAIVDDDCFDWLNGWSWCATPTSPAKTYATRSPRRLVRGGHIYMHRVVAGAGDGEMVDHINGDPLDNRRANLRFCNASGNAANTRRPPGVSGYRGVYPSGDCWMARIEWEGRRHKLGMFADPRDAAAAYDLAALRLHGEFAVLNFASEAPQ